MKKNTILNSLLLAGLLVVNTVTAAPPPIQTPSSKEDIKAALSG